MNFYIKNRNMNADAYAVLCRWAARQLTLRGLALADTQCEKCYSISVGCDMSMSGDRYVIHGASGVAVVTAANDLTAFAALGHLFEELHFNGCGSFVPFLGEIDFTPEKPLRGMYFATHFNNFYHNAPLCEVYEVVEDLAARGCNSLLVWFDMHHFSSMEDAGAIELTERLRAILAYANSIGMGGSLTMLSNEAFSSSPEHLRAEWDVQGGYTLRPNGHYHREICPSREGGIEEIIRERRQMLEHFADLKIDYVVYWPYDQGGCTCHECEPWGANGFLKILPHFRNLVAEMMPQTQVIVSSWYFDRFIPGEWDAFYDKMCDGALGDATYVMSFFFNGNLPDCIAEDGIPDGIEFVDFPEISMYSCTPWGGFGASVLTHFLGRTNSVCSRLYRGGFPYSEGVFEDANKYIQLMSYSGRYPDSEDALRAYVKYNFCCDDDELFRAILCTETALARVADSSTGVQRYIIKNTSAVYQVMQTMAKYNKTLPPSVTASRAFRLFYLRSLIDYELCEHDFTPTRSDACVSAMRELNAIYHVNSLTLGVVRPPVH